MADESPFADLPENIRAQALYQKALDYTGRYGGTAKKLEQILKKHIRKIARDPEQQAVAEQLIAGIIDILRKDNVVNDAAFAQARIRTRLDKGDSLALLRQRLAYQGVALEQIAQSLAALTDDDPDAEYQALRVYARKRGIAPDTPADDARRKAEQKLRARGFPHNLIARFWDEADS